MEYFNVKYFDKSWHILPGMYIDPSISKEEKSKLLDKIRANNKLPGWTYINISNFNTVLS